MTPDRFDQIASLYADLHLTVIGDVCLDRYMEIDPSLSETSIETGLAVHNVTKVRAQPGGAGTVIANLAALGVGKISVLSYCGNDGEGFELRRKLEAIPGVDCSNFLTVEDRSTFTYCKPIILEEPIPRELSRLDTKNWTPTPKKISTHLAGTLGTLAQKTDAVIVLEQTDQANTGVVTRDVRDQLKYLASLQPNKPIIADSRRGLHDYPPLSFKMNESELQTFMRYTNKPDLDVIRRKASELAEQFNHPIFITLGERGIISADKNGIMAHVPSFPVRGPIDEVGAGDSVTANIATALATGATIEEVCKIAMAAASYTIHQLGTTGSASVTAIRTLLAVR